MNPLFQKDIIRQVATLLPQTELHFRNLCLVCKEWNTFNKEQLIAIVKEKKARFRRAVYARPFLPKELLSTQKKEEELIQNGTKIDVFFKGKQIGYIFRQVFGWLKHWNAYLFLKETKWENYPTNKSIYLPNEVFDKYPGAKIQEITHHMSEKIGWDHGHYSDAFEKNYSTKEMVISEVQFMYHLAMTYDPNQVDNSSCIS